ncbi:MAG: hypothetical protein LUQ65_11490 [Candidatus Helarchaeota archaeon]|nr:hypothetical protein [Candidatus Helarchaeota archaeon]
MAYPERLIDGLWELEIALWIVALLIIYNLGYIFLKKYMREPPEAKLLNFGMCLFCFAYPTARVIELLRSYYVSFEYPPGLGYYDIILTNLHLTGLNLIMHLIYLTIFWSSMTILVYIIEKEVMKKWFFNTHKILTFFSGFTVILVIMMNFQMAWLIPLVGIIALAFVVSISCFLFYIAYRSEGNLRTAFVFSMIGFQLIVIGVLLTHQEFYFFIGEIPVSIEVYVRLAGPLSLIAGLVLWARGWQFELFVWVQKMQHLYVMMPNGICLYTHHFRPVANDQDLFTGALTGLSSLIQAMTKDKTRLKIIKQEDALILVEYGQKIIVALQTEEDSPVLRNKLEIFSAEFEEYFKEILKNWNGEIHLFSPANALVKRIFIKL